MIHSHCKAIIGIHFLNTSCFWIYTCALLISVKLFIPYLMSTESYIMVLQRKNRLSSLSSLHSPVSSLVKSAVSSYLHSHQFISLIHSPVSSCLYSPVSSSLQSPILSNFMTTIAVNKLIECPSITKEDIHWMLFDWKKVFYSVHQKGVRHVFEINMNLKETIFDNAQSMNIVKDVYKSL